MKIIGSGFLHYAMYIFFPSECCIMFLFIRKKKNVSNEILWFPKLPTKWYALFLSFSLSLFLSLSPLILRTICVGGALNVTDHRPPKAKKPRKRTKKKMTLIKKIVFPLTGVLHTQKKNEFNRRLGALTLAPSLNTLKPSPKTSRRSFFFKRYFAKTSTNRSDSVNVQMELNSSKNLKENQ